MVGLQQAQVQTQAASWKYLFSVLQPRPPLLQLFHALLQSKNHHWQHVCVPFTAFAVVFFRVVVLRAWSPAQQHTCQVLIQPQAYRVGNSDTLWCSLVIPVCGQNSELRNIYHTIRSFQGTWTFRKCVAFRSFGFLASPYFLESVCCMGDDRCDVMIA